MTVALINGIPDPWAPTELRTGGPTEFRPALTVVITPPERQIRVEPSKVGKPAPDPQPVQDVDEQLTDAIVHLATGGMVPSEIATEVGVDIAVVKAVIHAHHRAQRDRRRTAFDQRAIEAARLFDQEHRTIQEIASELGFDRAYVMPSVRRGRKLMMATKDAGMEEQAMAQTTTVAEKTELSKEQLNENIRAMAAKGLTAYAIAKKLNVGYHSVRKRVKALAEQQVEAQTPVAEEKDWILSAFTDADSQPKAPEPEQPAPTVPAPSDTTPTADPLRIAEAAVDEATRFVRVVNVIREAYGSDAGDIEAAALRRLKERLRELAEGAA